MSAEMLLSALVLAVVAYLLLARWTRSRRGALGISEGTIVSADDSLIRAPTLRSEHLGLVGRCDHLLRVQMRWPLFRGFPRRWVAGEPCYVESLTA